MFALEWQISPNNPFLSHFLNVFFYALSCFFIFVVLRKYLNKAHPLIPLFISLLYAAHPIHTEVVANIKSRDEIMSFFFLMLTLLFLYNWLTKRKVLSLIFSIIMFFLSIISKEGVVTMIFLFPVIGWFFTKYRSRIVISSLLLILPALVYIVIRHLILSKISGTTNVYITENFLIAAPDIYTHFATSILLMGKYLFLLIFPYQLICDYSFNQIPIIGLSHPKFIFSLVIYLVIGIYSIINFNKKSLLTFGLLFFLITSGLYSNLLIKIPASFGERLMFLPSLGFCIAFVSFITKWMKFETNSKTLKVIDIFKYKPKFIAVFISVLLILSIKTVIRASEWKNTTTLFKKDVLNSPNSANLHLWWGVTLFDKAEKIEDSVARNAMIYQAMAQFEKSIAIYKSYTECYERLGFAWQELKNYDKALVIYNKALNLGANDVVIYYNIGLCYYELGDAKKAMDFNMKAISTNSTYYNAYLNIGRIFGETGKYEESIVYSKKCIQYDPENITALNNLGLSYQNLNKSDSAKIWFDKAQMLQQKK